MTTFSGGMVAGRWRELLGSVSLETRLAVMVELARAGVLALVDLDLPAACAFAADVSEPNLWRAAGDIALFRADTDEGALPSASASILEREAAVQRLVDAGRVRQARELARGTRWEPVLAPPSVRKSEAASSADPRPNLRWLRDPSSRAPYAGQWVAIRNGQVLFASADLRDVRRQLQGERDVRDVLVERIDR